MKNDGLTQKQRSMIASVLEACPAVKEAILFGSRAMGNYKPASDVDLFLVGEKIGMNELLQLHRGIDDLPLPIDVDLLADTMLQSPDVRRHIRQHGHLWWLRSSGLQS
ncbi:MAG: nucleotidyltransferase domain-containing protein [Akkermansia sp.]|nr:nucleotidyltransferase domain-containing protein [Akkermansia sp.]MBQ8375626.1 nucleotidyltransferase domain-containing protein [Akkermansia sp.]